jgi:uncharacterized protein (DUF427 family)
MEYLKENGNQTNTEKGQVHYFDIVVDNEVYKNGAWYYSDLDSSTRNFANYIAFAEGVNLEA